MTEHLFDPSSWIERQETGGLVYIMVAGREAKIGFTTRTAEERCREFATSNPGIRVAGVIEGGDRHLERDLHAYFWQEHIQGEWFHLTPEILDVANERWLPEAIFRSWFARRQGFAIKEDLGDLNSYVGALLKERYPEDYEALRRPAEVSMMAMAEFEARMDALTSDLDLPDFVVQLPDLDGIECLEVIYAFWKLRDEISHVHGIECDFRFVTPTSALTE